jgi:uncharacterized membrane protein
VSLKMVKTSALRHMVYELKGGYLLLPVSIMLVLSIVAIILPKFELENASVVYWTRHISWLVPSDPGMAQLMLGAMAGSCITIVSVVYSVLLIALTFASMQFSPRILSRFIKDRVSQATLGFFIGTFAYSLILLPSVHSGAKTSTPTLSLTVALLLATFCLVYLIYFIHHLAIAIQVNYIVDRIAAETEVVVSNVFGPPLKGFPIAEDIIREPRVGMPISATRSGYIQYVNEKKLLSIAAAENGSIYVHRGVGQFIPAGISLITLQTLNQVTDSIKQQCLSCFYIGPVRSMEDDVEFGVLQLVDIALKAISPAVNDPSTAINCIDNLSRILLKSATLEPPVGRIVDENAVVRLVRRRPTFPRLLEIAFNQIGPYAKNDMAVSLRLMRVLFDLSSITNYPPYLNAIRIMGEKILFECRKNFTDCQELSERIALALILFR